jgi:predicted nucleotidyltransferase
MIRFKPLPEDIEQRLSRAIEYLQSHPKVGFAYLFGGLARYRRSPMSDVDIAVWLTMTRSAAGPSRNCSNTWSMTSVRKRSIWSC